ncbi:MAG: homocitrate synthase/isopropylmalate synthase family protein [Candidatus Cyclobacteriaceae bacterium M3_2C_046]
MKCSIIDTTLRDGEQAPGVVFNWKDKLQIACELEKLGIEEVEIGTPALSSTESGEISRLIECQFNFKTLVWSRARTADILQASQTRADGINISFPVSTIQLSALEKNYDWVRLQLPRIIRTAKDHFSFVAVGAQDASRANAHFLEEYVSICLQQGVNRVRIADTVGVFNPQTTYQLMHKLKSRFGSIQFEFHGHNDLGMAVGNAVSAILAGTDAVSATINGIGERAGNVPLEELLMALKVSARMNMTYDLKQLKHVSDLVANLSGRPLALNKPVTGSMAFCHESGIHCSSLIKDKNTYQPFDETIIGNSMINFYFGKHSGKAILKHYFLKAQRVNLSDQDCTTLLKQVKELAQNQKGQVTPAQLNQLFLQLYSHSQVL